MLTLNIDGNKFDMINSNFTLKINGIPASEKEEVNFLETLREATESDGNFDKQPFYDNYDIVNLDNLSDKIHKFNIFEMNRGSWSVASFWGRDNASEVKNALYNGYNGGEPLSDKESLESHLEYYIDRNYKMFTKNELRDFIINRKDINNLYHASVIQTINKL